MNGNRIRSKVVGPPDSPDLTPRDFLGLCKTDNIFIKQVTVATFILYYYIKYNKIYNYFIKNIVVSNTFTRVYKTGRAASAAGKKV